MTPAERKAASRAKGASSADTEPSEASGAKVTPLPAPSTTTRPGRKTEPTPLGSSLQELEFFAAAMKARAIKPEASASDVSTYQRALAELAELRGDTFELTEGSLARSAAFRRYRDRIIDCLRPFPDALRAVRDAVAELEATS